MHTRCIIAPVAALLVGGAAHIHAQDLAEPAAQSIMVTATRVETPIEKVGNSISVISAEDLSRTKIKNVSDALRLVPGVSVSQSGGPGQPVSVFMRGAPAGFTRVIIDGIVMNDPGGIGTGW